MEFNTKNIYGGLDNVDWAYDPCQHFKSARKKIGVEDSLIRLV